MLKKTIVSLVSALYITSSVGAMENKNVECSEILKGISRVLPNLDLGPAALISPNREALTSSQLSCTKLAVNLTHNKDALVEIISDTKAFKLQNGIKGSFTIEDLQLIMDENKGGKIRLDPISAKVGERIILMYTAQMSPVNYFEVGDESFFATFSKHFNGNAEGRRKLLEALPNGIFTWLNGGEVFFNFPKGSDELFKSKYPNFNWYV